MASFGQPLKLS